MIILFICCLASSLHHMNDGCCSSHSAVDLPTLDAAVLNDVRDLDHYPQRRMVPRSTAETDENRLAIRIYDHWEDFQPSTRSKLELIKQESEELKNRVAARESLAEVRQLGYRPRERSSSKQERSLAKRIRRDKMEEYLTPAELKEFQALPEFSSISAECEGNASRSAREVLAEVRQFSCRPRESSLSEQERSLAKRIREDKMEKYLTSAELEEFQVFKKSVDARELLAEVKEFGYRPRRRSVAEQESLLANRIQKAKMEEYLTPAELKEFQALPSSGVEQPVASNEQQDDEHAQFSATPGTAAQLKIRLRGKTSMEKLKIRLRGKTSMGLHCVADAQTRASAAKTIAPSAARKRAARSDACHSSTAQDTPARKRAKRVSTTAQDTYSCCKDLRSIQQRLAEWKQQQVHIDPEAEQCYRELCRRIELMLSEPSRETLLQERVQKAALCTKNKQKATKPPKRQLTDWWINASIIDKPATPVYYRVAENEKLIQNKISLTLMHYLMSHVLLDDIRRFIGDGTHLAIRTTLEKQRYTDFFTACRDPVKRKLAPWPATEELQSGTSAFKPFVCFRHLALIELVDNSFTDLPHDHKTLLQDLITCRTNEESQCRLQSEMIEKAVQRLIAYMKVQDNNFANARFLNLTEVVGASSKQKVRKVTSELAAETSLRKMVNNLHYAFEKQNIDMTCFKPNQFAALSVYYDQCLTQITSKTNHWLNRRYCSGLKQYVPGDAIEALIIKSEGKEKQCLASQCLPDHCNASGVSQPAALGHSGLAVASAPVVCELCHKGLSGLDTLQQHCRRAHKGFAEYRKRIFYKAREAGQQPLFAWLKRQMAQSFQYFRFFCTPGTPNEWTSRTHERAEPRREEACAVCACKDWLNNRYEVYLFKEATGSTTWARHYRYGGNDDNILGEEHDENPRIADGSQSTLGSLLVEDNGAFCLGPKDKIHKILNVERYIQKWPLIPQAELHASSVQHPDDISMRWLLHSRRVTRMPRTPETSSGARAVNSLPPTAGIGDKDTPVWMCKSCVEHLCTQHPKMPPLALANWMFLGRHHPVFKEAALASRMLASSARLLMRQLFLGRGTDEEVHKGMTDNTMLVSQPSPSYAQVLPNTTALTEGLVVLFCKSSEDVSKVQVWVVNREEYRFMVQHGKKVCPEFANISIDNEAIDNLPDYTHCGDTHPTVSDVGSGGSYSEKVPVLKQQAILSILEHSR